ncbi:hypothetical protein [Mesobacillus zeae]|uniref:ATPase n=1 Tax=Mesobacillus zeae TaxID=1917180 RepID=A0A398BBK3_9BACI|nr:hypothetical protein [Mesobacillus zeae]RID85056.1 hypothetical protein D1970_10850 [Mesobacillus zeae]
MEQEIKYLSSLHLDLLKDLTFNYEENSTLVLDLVTVMAAIFREDVHTKKYSKPRVIQLIIPVFNPVIWTSSVRKVEELTRWVSGDTFKFSFIKTPFTFDGFMSRLELPSSNAVTLFSGGLDSFCGAFHNLANGIKSDYVGFINKGEERTKQEAVATFYKGIFDDTTEIILVEKPFQRKEYFVQSTRSLLYLALSIAKAFFNKSNDVYLYENGILSLNPELKNRYTTKTTHPRTIFLYHELLSGIGIALNIHHPFLFKTKGEIINSLNLTFKKAIKKTFTCGQSRTNPERNHHGQCGICIPCLLRKISLAAYDNEKFDVEYQYGYEIKPSDISEDVYRKDYISNLDYFKTYVGLIRAGNAHLEIKTREKYYKGIPDFREKNQEMFNKFSEEYERFLIKYAPD